MKIIFAENDEIWFGLKDLLKCLGYTSAINQTTRIKIEPENKKQYVSITKSTSKNIETKNNISNDTMFINVNGLHDVLNYSRKLAAIKFRKDFSEIIAPMLKK